jgi:putative DNA methylase
LDADDRTVSEEADRSCSATRSDQPRVGAREKSIRHGHPSTLHLWWARRPLAACRAVLFASIVDDPSSRPDLFPTEDQQEAERQRLFRLIEELVKWENTTNETVLEAAREEIRKATDGNPPPVLDPFCGGGSIPLEAQRLGLKAHASDLNPVAVLITKALIEIPPKFAGRPPVNPESRAKLAHSATWKGAQGLAEDVRYYGKWMRDEAFKRIGHLYPTAKLIDGGEAIVIAWLWTRTVTCPNPACGARMPLVRSFALSTKKGKERHVLPVVEGGSVRFVVREGNDAPAGTVNRRGARCVSCQNVAPLTYIRSEAQAGCLSAQLMAIVAEGNRARTYLAPSSEHEAVAVSSEPEWGPEELVTTPSHDVDRLPMYGMRRWRDAFTPRQLVALTTFSDLVGQARERVAADGRDEAYADAIATYLGFAVDRSADFWSTIATWSPQPKNEICGSHLRPSSNSYDVGFRRNQSFQSIGWQLRGQPVVRREGDTNVQISGNGFGEAARCSSGAHDAPIVCLY